MQKKKGISLIVLIITIIVMIILAAAIILTLNNSGIINRANEAVEKTDLVQVKNLATLKWAEAYLDENIKAREDYKKYIEDGLKESGINPDDYNITVTESGVEVQEKFPSEWKENITAIVDTVPIPKGFVASPYDGENTKNGGLVIYELAEGEISIPNTETQYTSWTTRNQYVWVPVPKEDFTKKFVRQNFEMSYTLSSTLGINFWEVVVDERVNLPLTTIEEQSETYMSEATLVEVQKMYASVKEYGGFYIARYEAGINSQRTSYKAALITGSNVHSKMGKIPYTNIEWNKSGIMNENAGAAVEVARGLYSENDETNTTGVVSTLIYGVQWDRTLAWWQELDSKFSITSSTDYGNYKEHKIISSDDLNDGAQVAVYNTSKYTLGSYVSKSDASLAYPKESGTIWALSTGALKAANVNNIYDMAGNVHEWTMEGGLTGHRIFRGGDCHCNFTEEEKTVAYRFNHFPNYAESFIGFRIALYIKK